MNIFRNVLVMATLLCMSFTSPISAFKRMEEDKQVKVLLETTKGDVVISLSNMTPGHRDNFVKNVKAGAYDGVLFHRVIKDFMIQTGDPTSRNAALDAVLGANDFGEEIPGEFILPELFHKKGAVAAARTGDAVNPEKKSSGSQFYIVTGKVYNDSELVAMEKSLQNQQKQALFQSLAKAHKEEIMNLRRARNMSGLQELQDRLITETEDSLKGRLFKFTPEQKNAYTTVGGAPFLDGGYSVFGEVVSGMDVVDAIQCVETGRNDRPMEDIKIIKASLSEE